MSESLKPPSTPIADSVRRQLDALEKPAGRGVATLEAARLNGQGGIRGEVAIRAGGASVGAFGALAFDKSVREIGLRARFEW